MAEGGIFIDILTRLNLASVERVLKDVNTVMRDAGGRGGRAFSEGFKLDGAVAQFKELSTAADGAYRDMQTGLANLQIQEAKINELRARNFKYTSDAMISAQRELDAAILNSQKLMEASAARSAEQRGAMAAIPARGGREPDSRGGRESLIPMGRGANIAGAGAALGLAGLGVEGARVAGTTQRNMQQVAAFHQDATHDRAYTDRQTQDIYQMSTRVPYSPQELSKVYQDVENHGYTGKAAIDVLETSARTATATGASLKDTTDGLMTSVKDFGTQTELQSNNIGQYKQGLSDLNQMAGQLVTTFGNLKGVNPDEFFRSLGTIEPTAMATMLGPGSRLTGPQASAQVNSSLALLAQIGIGPEQGSHNVSRIMSQLGAVVPGSNMYNMLGQLGIPGGPEGIAGAMRDKGVFGPLQSIQQAINAKTNPKTGLVDIGWRYNNQQTDSLIQQDLDQLPPEAKAFVQGHPEIAAGNARPFALKKSFGDAPWGQDVLTLADWYKTKASPNKYTKKGGSTELTPEQVYQQLFGTGDIARTGIALGQNAQEGQTMADMLTNSGTSALDNAFKDMMSTLPEQWKQLGSSLQSLAGQLGQHLLPALTHFVQELNGVADWLDKHKGAEEAIVDTLTTAAATWAAFKLHIPQTMLKGWENFKPNYQGGYGPPAPLKDAAGGPAAAGEISGAGEKAGAAMAASITEGGTKAAGAMGGAVTEGGVKAAESLAASLTAATAKVGEQVGAGVVSGAAKAGETLGASITGAGSRAAEAMGAAITTAGATAAAEMRSGMPLPGGVVPRGGGEPGGGGKGSRLGGFLGFAGRFAPEAFLANAAGDELKQYQHDHPGQWNPSMGPEPPQLQQYLKDQGYSRGGITGYDSGTSKVADPFSQPLMGQPDMKRDSLLGMLPGGKPVGLRGGEGILTPEAVQAIGGKSGVDSLNSGSNPWSNPGKVASTFYGSFADGVAKYSPWGKYLKATSQSLNSLEKEFDQTTKLHEADGGHSRKLRGVPAEIQQMLASGMSPEQVMQQLGVHSGKRSGLQMGSGSYLSNNERSMLGLPPAKSSGKSPWAKNSNEETVHGVFSKYFPESEWPAYRNLEMHEAGFDPTAKNPSGAYGVGQFMPYTWGQYGTTGKTDDLSTQAEDQMKYIRGRYGDPNSAWGQYFNHPGGEGSYRRGGIVGYDAGGVVGGLKDFSGQSSDDDLINYHGHWVKRPQSLGDWGALSDFYHSNQEGIQNSGGYAWEKNDPNTPDDATVGGMKSAVGIGDDPTIPGMRQALKGIGHGSWPGFSTGGIVGFADGGIPLAPPPAPAPPGPAPGPVAPGGSAAPPPNITSQAQEAGIAPTDNPQGPTPPPNISDAARAAGIAPTDKPDQPPKPGDAPKPPQPGTPSRPAPKAPVDQAKGAKVLTPQGDQPGHAPGPEDDRKIQKNPSRQGGQENTSKGFGLGGGLVGFAESLPGMALSAAGGAGDAAGGMGGGSAAAGAANAAMQIGFQEANRAIGYGGQLLGIFGEGLLETFLPNDSPMADPTNNLFGKVALGIAGAHPSPKNQAGSSAMQMKPKEDLDAGANQAKQVMPMVHMDHPTIHNYTGDHQETGNSIMKAAFGLPVGGQP